MTADHIQPGLIESPSSLPIHFIGPPLSEGKLPAVFYFSLSGQESLSLDPFNLPALALSQHKIRVYSLTLPAHEGTHPHASSMHAWAAAAATGDDFVGKFAADCTHALDFLEQNGWITPGAIAAAGLSRGAFAAAHFAAHDKRVKYLLGFAPLTRLQALKEFQESSQNTLCEQMSLQRITEHLAGKIVRLYIGNRDTRVGTDDCYAFARDLTEAAYHLKHRSPPVELIIYPSVGHKGHGTPPGIFLSGAEWLGKILIGV